MTPGHYYTVNMIGVVKIHKRKPQVLVLSKKENKKSQVFKKKKLVVRDDDVEA